MKGHRFPKAIFVIKANTTHRGGDSRGRIDNWSWGKRRKRIEAKPRGVRCLKLILFHAAKAVTGQYRNCLCLCAEICREYTAFETYWGLTDPALRIINSQFVYVGRCQPNSTVSNHYRITESLRNGKDPQAYKIVSFKEKSWPEMKWNY